MKKNDRSKAGEQDGSPKSGAQDGSPKAGTQSGSPKAGTQDGSPQISQDKSQKKDVGKKSEELPGFRQVMGTFFRMIRLGMPKWILCLIGSVIMGLSSYGISLIIGLLSGLTLIYFRAHTSALSTVGGLLLAMMGIVGAQTLGYVMNMKGGMRIRANIQKRLISAWIRQTEGFASRHHTGDAMALVTSDMDIVEDFYFQGFAYQFMSPLFQGIAATVTVASIDYRLLAPPVLAGLISVFFSVRLSGQVREKNQRVRTETDRMTRVFSEIASGNEAYRSMGMASSFLERYVAQSEDYADLCAKADNITVDINFFIRLMSVLSEIGFLGIGLWLSSAGQLDFALVLLAFPLQTLISGMMGCFGPSWNFIIKAGIAGERIMGALKWPTEEADTAQSAQAEQAQSATQAAMSQSAAQADTAQSAQADCDVQTPQPSSHHLKLSCVDFSYEEGKSILHQFSADIPWGRKLALVGPSGSGKSTALQLLLRFYRQDSGTIVLDGKDASQYTLESWRSSFVFLQQDAPVLAKTVWDNIAMGLYGNGAEPSEAEILDAAKAAGIHDFIMNLPEEYQTVVTEGGQSFSGGQRQRLAIARAFLSNAPIVLLDEPTAALDVESEQLVQQSLTRLMEGRTVVMVAHRLETVREFDEIIVLDRGTVVQRGTHEQLMEQRGLYAELYRTQTEGAANAAPIDTRCAPN